MNRILVSVGLVALMAGVLWFFPLFHIVPLDKSQGEAQQLTFDAATYAQTFLQEKLPKLTTATDATELITALRKNPAEVPQQLGRTVGVSRASTYFLQGRGRIVSVEASGVGVSLQDDGPEPDIVLQTGPLFGNTVRDSTGQIAASEFPNSQHFNDVSTALNRLIESGVMSELKRRAQPGGHLRFVGCAELTGQSTKVIPLKVIPIEVVFE
jgi:predicted lipoprotein